MDTVLFDLFDVDRLKRAQADVQGDLGRFDAAGAYFVQDLRSEVQSRRGGRDRAALAGVHRLITLPVVGTVGASEVGRQGDVAQALQRGEEIRRRGEAQAPFAVVSACHDLGQEFALPEFEVFAHVDFASGTDQGFPFGRILAELPGQQYLDPAFQEIACRRIPGTDLLRV